MSPIFSDGFDSGNFSEWTAVGGVAMMIHPFHHDGTYGALSQESGWCYRGIAMARRVSWKFYYMPVYIYAPGGGLFRVARVTTVSGAPVAEVTLEHAAGSGYSWSGRLGLRYWSDSGVMTSVAVSGPVLQSLVWCLVELRYVAATEAGANDGHLELWQDGVKVAEVNVVDNDTLAVGRCYLYHARLSGSCSAWVSWDTAEADALSDRGYRIYHNGGAGVVDYAAPAGARNQYASSWTSGMLACPATWRFGVRAHNEHGEERNLNVATELALLGSGSPSPMRPNRPADLAATAAAGGRVEIAFAYDETGEAAACTHFHVYADDGSGAIDYATAVGAVAKDDAGPFSRYLFVTGALADGAPRRFAVRAATSGDIEDDGTESVPVTPDASAPAQPASLTVNLVC